MTTVTLKIKKENTEEKVQYEIEEVNIAQFQESLKVVKNIFEIIQTDPSLRAIFQEMMNDAEVQDKELDVNLLLTHAVGAFELLLMNIPDQAIKLISAMSGIKLEVLKTQKLGLFFDVYDAIIEENDIERLIKRAKKSLLATKAKINFKKLTNLATAK